MIRRSLSARSTALIGKLDRSNSRLFSILPTRYKQAVARRVLGALYPSAKDEPLLVDGMRFLSTGTIQERMWLARDNESLRHFLTSLLRPGMNVLDIGANVGFFTLFAAQKVGPRGTVYAVEPTESSVEFLRKNVALNQLDNVVVVPYAAGSRRELRDFWVRKDSSAKLNSLYSTHVRAHAATVSVLKVEVVPLDEIVEKKIDLIKLDVEGAELEALAGMPRIFENPDLQMIVEWHPLLHRAVGYQPLNLPEWLSSQGFALHTVVDGNVTPVGSDQLEALSTHLVSCAKYVDLFAAR